jgi:hypothetical protein
MDSYQVPLGSMNGHTAELQVKIRMGATGNTGRTNGREAYFAPTTCLSNTERTIERTVYTLSTTGYSHSHAGHFKH